MNNKYGLTFPQQNIWLVENFYDSKKINSISGSLKIYKDFDINIAKKTINKFVELNDAMRIKIEVCEDKVLQVLMPHANFDIPVEKVDIHNKKEVTKIKKEFVSKTISALDNCLFSYLILDGGKQGEIVLNVHHIISDAWSVSKMGEELAALYDKIQNGEADFKKYPSYIDFIKKEIEYSQSDRFRTDSDFWKEYLKGFDESVGLKDGEVFKSSKARRYETQLDKNIEKKLNIYCKENRLSPYTVFMTALAIYMERVTEKQDIIIGTPVLNRSNFAEKNMQGMFVSTMPIRFKIDEKDTFLELCKKTAIDTMTLFRHQKYPYSKISEEHKNESGNIDKLFKVMLSYQNARTEFEDKEKYEITWDFAGEIQDELEIHVSDLNNDGRLKIFYDYIEELFEPIEIKYLAKRIEEIIRDGIENNKTIETINIMPEEEKNKILYEFNNTKRPYPKDKTVIDLFEEQVEKTPNNIALVFEGKEMTYKELNEKANQVAWYLKEKGIQENEFIGLIVDKSIELIISIIGILKLGCCYVPVEINYSSDRKKYMLKDSGCKFVIIDDNEKNDLEIQTININQININNYETKNTITRSERYTSDSPNCVLYTSGTTGEPKGAIIINRNIVKLVKNADYISFKEEDEILQAASTSFDVSLFEIWGSLLNGGKLHIIKKFNLINPRYLTEYLRKDKITILWITSALFNQMIEANANMFYKLRRIFTGGDRISIKHVNQLKEICPNLLITNCYGPTECTTFTNTFNIEKKQFKRIPIGKAISNTIGYVVDSKLRLLPLYTYGEYIIAGESVALGYVNKQELTEEKFIKNMFNDIFECDRMYKSGDIVQMLEGGYIDFIGRRDNQVKIRGFRIELDEIRLAMLSYSKNIKDVAVIIIEYMNNKSIAAFYTSNILEVKENLKEYLKSKLPYYMIPSSFMQIESMPINQNGKIDRKKLSIMNIDNEELNEKINYTYKGVYLDLYNIFKKTLNIKSINPNDNFFEIGGDSLSAIKVITQSMQKGLSITFADLYKYPSIKELGDMLNNFNIKQSISENIKSYNYTKINELLDDNRINKLNIENMGNVLLTGSTGFLGAHILDELLKDNRKRKIYCLIREKENDNIENRLRKKLQYFFGNRYDRLIGKNIIPIKGDITIDNVIEDNYYKDFMDDIDTVINSAASVKHFGNIEFFKNINEIGVKNLAELCLKNNKKLIHISTLSVSGNILETGQIQQTEIAPNTIYNETNFYIGQNLDNVYAYSKFMGEKVVYDYIINHNLNAKIMRMGNLTGRYTDGKFQPNVEENAFANRLKAIIEMKVLPENIENLNIEFTPVDYAARAIVILSKLDNSYKTFHIFNNNHVKMKYLNSVLMGMGINLRKIKKSEMTNLIDEYNKSSQGQEIISGIILDLNKNKELDYETNTIIKSEFTINILNKFKFKWPKIRKEYIEKYINSLFSVNFIERGNGNANK